MGVPVGVILLRKYLIVNILNRAIHACIDGCSGRLAVLRVVRTLRIGLFEMK